MFSPLLAQYLICFVPNKNAFHLLEVRLTILDAFGDILVLSIIVQFSLQPEVEFQFVELSLDVLVLLKFVG